MNENRSFPQWLGAQCGRNDPIGDLARDSPRSSFWWTPGELRRALERRGACDSALDAVDAAGVEWAASQPEVAFRCPTCKAEPGQPCTKRRRVYDGGPSHLTRVDKFIRSAR